MSVTGERRTDEMMRHPNAHAAAGVTVKVSAILAVVRGGLFAYEGFAGLLVPGQLFLLAALGLVLGAMLTVAVLWFGLRFAEVVVGGEVGKADARSASDRDQRDRGGPG